jgi:hypothetical protein
VEPYVPPALANGYLRRFATWAAMFLIAIAVGFGVQVWQAGYAATLAEDNLWTMARLVAGTVALSAFLACVRDAKGG